MRLNAPPCDHPEAQVIATQKYEGRGGLQRQEIIEVDERNRIGKMTADKDSVTNVETDISASQKMLSAVSGSLLTSLLGEHRSSTSTSLSLLD